MTDALQTTIRMYRFQGMGECFFLTFERGKKRYDLLIDCGTLDQTKTSQTHLQKVVADIQKELSGKPLDAVFATHRHTDHLSGFATAKAQFAKLGIQQVFLSWLENPDDHQGRSLSRAHRQAIDKSRKMSEMLAKKQGPLSKALHDRVQKIHSNLGLGNGNESLMDEAIQFLKEVGKQSVQYLQPGQIIRPPDETLGGPAIRFHVLGPPRKYQLSKHEAPTEDPHLLSMSRHLDTFCNALDPDCSEEEHFPFNQKYRVGNHVSPQDNLDGTNKKGYKQLMEAYTIEDWQRIDDDWMLIGERLARHLNACINNTSLAFAIELVDSGTFLLFTADAQVGSWQTWKSIKWQEEDHPSLEEMLRKVVFYKVGHHGSHNGTLQWSLERMTHPDLVAFMPVFQNGKNSAAPQLPWRMPASNLYRALLQKTRGRVVRADSGKVKVPGNTKQLWKGKRIKENKNKVEYTFT